MSCQSTCNAICETGSYAVSSICMNGVCTQATCRRPGGICLGGEGCNCILGHVGELCLLTVVVGVVVIVILVLSIAYCVQKHKKKKTTSAALVSASSELKDGDTVEHAIEVNDGSAEEEKLFQPSARALARGLISVILLAIVLSNTVKMSEVKTTYDAKLAEMTTTFSADLSTLRVEVDGSIPGLPSFPIAEDSMTWEEYCVAVENFEAVIETFRDVGLLIPGPVQCSYVAPARSFIIAAVTMYSVASVCALHSRGDTFGMVTSMLGWVFVVTGVSFWFAVLGAWTGIETGVGILLSIALFGVTIITCVLPKRP